MLHVLDRPRRGGLARLLVGGLLLIGVALCPGCDSVVGGVLADRGLQIAEGAVDAVVYRVMDDVHAQIRGWRPFWYPTSYGSTITAYNSTNIDAIADAVADRLEDED